MILVDASVWIDHFRNTNTRLSALLNSGQVLTHPFVIGELALGELEQRAAILDAAENLPMAIGASDLEVRRFISAQRLFGRGIGYVDAHLLAAVTLTAGSSLWTLDKRLDRVAKQLALSL